ncbi:SDR family oxidoreductase [Chryseobacterium sp.]|uniref:SDR family NAD(P)-dependent oxidoreductase n=1 Tax=Chryseobacterium sp. TaxID=1871047 RepID=UPI000EDF54B1|nr:SDR family oxidoreductase [Chryseobacterium sp.]HCA07574.1 short-chain dehydrogenase [Chryseobacterium sp.]
MKNIIISGATSGIGLGLCLDLLHKEEYKIIAIGRDFTNFNDALSKGQMKKENVVLLTLDLSNPKEIEENLQHAIDKIGKIDYFVNCAGVEDTNAMISYNYEKLRNIFDVNFFAAFEIMRIFSKKKNSNEGGSVVLLSSVMGQLGQYGKTAYCSSKSAILGLVKAGALDLSKRKIRVNAVLPGVVETPMTQNLFQSLSSENVAAIEKMHPLGLGKVEDVVKTIEFLISDDSRWITGQSIVIDGGYSIQ